jgi:hypothetical protein
VDTDEVDAEALSLFAQFARLNPQFAPDDPVMGDVFTAYTGWLVTDDEDILL